ncbi:uncharacterized protein LOC134542782 isoform X2 [Bacillus rossius redtenbacheri]|uniref:uncharacterized protein LOC134542782 isoform X2 n=1 Tax=Bacillus rossius redtenbacheri TaxID=93214 RepID=UPI002FDE7020
MFSYHSYGRAQLEEFVLEQWKLADLRDMGEACLPPDLSAKTRVTLPGKYSLQVESMVDIGAPCYGQLQRIRKEATENLEVSETKAQAWEPRPTRMLRLSLCDGVQEILGIEYRPIRKLDLPLVPGCKVLVVGPVDCRRGVALLQERSLQLLGGEVDSLLVPNALENLLARKLNLEENPQPYLTGLPPPEEAAAPHVTGQHHHHHHPAAAAVSSGRPVAQVLPMTAHDFNEDDILHCAELDEIEKRFQQEMDDIPDDMFFNDDVDNPQANSPSGWNVGSRQAATYGGTGNVRLPTAHCNGIRSSAGLEQFRGDNRDTSISNRMSPVMRKNTISVARKNSGVDQNPHLLNAGTALMKSRTNSFNDFDEFETDDFFEKSSYSTKTCVATGDASVHAVDLLEQDDELLLDISSQDLDASILPAQTETTPPSNTKTLSVSKPSSPKQSVKPCKKPAQRNQSKITSFITKNHTGSTGVGSADSCVKKMAFSPVAVKRPPSSPLKKVPAVRGKASSEQKKYKSVDAETSRTPASKRPEKTFILSNAQDLHGTADVVAKETVLNLGAPAVCRAPSEALCSSLIMEHKPFVYLSQLEGQARTGVATFTVKAFVLTLVNQLVLKREGWHMTCKINDGSTLMEVSFSPEVLEKLIGYTPAEIRVLRQQMATNPSVKEKIKGALSDAQKKLVNLNCLLDLTFRGGSSVPEVTAISEVGQEHVELLGRRLSALSAAAGAGRDRV